MDLSVIDLFAGVGGFRVGLNKIREIDESSGRAIEAGDWDFVWANQYEPATKSQPAFECYIKRFGAKEVSNVDINLVDKELDVPNHNLLVGGFPCQDYSVARSLSNEKGINGKKGVLFWEIVKILEAKKPPFVLLENVDRLLKSPASLRGRDFAVMLKTLDINGYYVVWRVINAADYGMPQRRRRVFIFAFAKDSKYGQAFAADDTEAIIYTNLLNHAFPIVFKEYQKQKRNLNDYRDLPEVSDTYHGGKFFNFGFMKNGVTVSFDPEPAKEKVYSLGEVLNLAEEYNPKDKSPYLVEAEKLDKWKYLKGAKRIERTAKNGHKYVYSEGGMAFPEDLTKAARTMLTSEGTLNRSSHIILDKNLNKYRILTPVECELLQMFPPHWTATMPDRNRYFMMGNALVTGVISRLEPELKRIIRNE